MSDLIKAVEAIFSGVRSQLRGASGGASHVSAVFVFQHKAHRDSSDTN